MVCMFASRNDRTDFFFDTALFKQFLEKLSSSLSSHNWMEGWKNQSRVRTYDELTQTVILKVILKIVLSVCFKKQLKWSFIVYILLYLRIKRSYKQKVLNTDRRLLPWASDSQVFYLQICDVIFVHDLFTLISHFEAAVNLIGHVCTACLCTRASPCDFVILPM